MRTTHWTKVGLTIALGTAIVVGLLAALSHYATPAQAQEARPRGDITAQDTYSTTYVVVEFASGTRSGRRITWTTPISRIAGLKLAGFNVENDGDAICSIDGEGCPTSECFTCGTNFWAQGRWLAGAWDTSEWPPPDLENGDVIGFRNTTSFATWGPPEVPAPRYVAIADAFEWLRPQQSASDGSYPSALGNMGPTLDMILAVTANSDDPNEWRRELDSPSLVNYITGTNGFEYANGDASKAGKLAVALAAADPMSQDNSGVCWPAAAKKVTNYYDPDTGTFYEGTADQAGIQTWAMLGLAALGQAMPTTATNALMSMANPDGGWGWSSAWGGSDTMVTAQAIQALVAAGVPTTSTSIQDGLAYLKSSQNSDGGFFYTISGDSDIGSTAYAIQAIVAVGQDPITGTWRTISGTTFVDPISFLLNVQQSDGSFPGYSPLMATHQALPALLYRPFPLAVADVPDCWTWRTYMPLISMND